MTIHNSIRRAGTFAGDGVRVEYPFAFKVFAETDVRAYVADTHGNESQLAYPQDYAVTLNPDQETHPGGTVRLTQALAVGYVMTLTSAMPAVQPMEFTNQGGFYPRVLNDALDRLTILVQQLEERVGRAMLGSVNSGAPLSLPVAQAGRLLGWDTRGALVNVDFEGRMESDDTKGGTERIATAEAVKKVGDKLTEAVKTLTNTQAGDKKELQDSIASGDNALTQSIAQAKQEIVDLRQALNAVEGGDAALKLVERIVKCEQAVQEMGTKVDNTVQTMNSTIAQAAQEMRQETADSLKKLRVLALAGL